jgi:hypothetical protein
MTYNCLLLIYGLTFIAAICNTPKWCRLNYQALRDSIHRRYLMARLAITLFNIGVLIGVSFRASEVAARNNEKIEPIPLIVGLTRDMQYIFWGNHSAMVFAISTTFLLVGEVLMLFASAVAIRLSGKRPLNWRVFDALGAVWTLKGQSPALPRL